MAFSAQLSLKQRVLNAGLWSVAGFALSLVIRQGGNLLMTRLLTPEMFGVMAMASTAMVGLAMFSDVGLTKLMNDVSFLAFSEIGCDRAENLKANYYRFPAVITSVAYLAAGAFMTFGSSLINHLYDPRYQAAGWILQFLAAVLITVPFRLATQSFLVLGTPKLQTNVVILRLVVLLSATPIGFCFFGLEGSLLGIVLSHSSVIPSIALYNVRHKLFDLRKELYLLVFLPLGPGAGKVAAVALIHWR
jgi:O-antigen/teichoic acid export membrane protein